MMMAMHRWDARVVMAGALLAASCSAPPPEPPPPQPATRRAQPHDSQAATTAATPAAAAPAPVQTGPVQTGPVQTRKTVGKTTQTVLDLAEALAQGGVVVEDANPAGGGALDAAAGAYRSSVARIGGMQVEQKMKLYQAEHGSLPATHAEFMKTIIAPGTPDEVSLPMLPYYQEYAFDPGSKSIVLVEFPAKKEQRQRETTGAAGL